VHLEFVVAVGRLSSCGDENSARRGQRAYNHHGRHKSHPRFDLPILRDHTFQSVIQPVPRSFPPPRPHPCIPSGAVVARCRDSGIEPARSHRDHPAPSVRPDFVRPHFIKCGRGSGPFPERRGRVAHSGSCGSPDAETTEPRRGRRRPASIAPPRCLFGGGASHPQLPLRATLLQCSAPARERSRPCASFCARAAPRCDRGPSRNPE